MFKVKTDGTGFTSLYDFTATDGNGHNSDGANPFAELTLSGNTLYGTTKHGGNWGNGTVFSVSLLPAPQLTIYRFGANVVLTWPTNYAGFTLQSTTNLVPPVVWANVSPAPVVVNGQNTVTNATSGARKYYRLSQ